MITVHEPFSEDEPSFAARLRRSLAWRLASRSRAGSAQLQAPRLVGDGHQPVAWARLRAPLEGFKAAVFAANAEADSNDGVLPDATRDRIVEQFHGFCALLNEVLLDDMDGQEHEELAAWLQRELLPYLLLTETAQRWYTKPRGYPGDFLTLEMVYRNEPDGRHAIGWLVDHCFLDVAAAHAVRHRRGLLAEEIAATVAARGGDTARVSSLACGPAREVFDAFSQLDDPTILHVNLLDIDPQALAFVAERAGAEGLEAQVSLISDNLLRLAVGRCGSDIHDQDLVYSIGLIDYLKDGMVVRLMDLIHGMLRPGGRIILGNFHPSNATRGLMDHVLDWKLVHRTEADMDRLFEASAFGRPATRIRFEERGINLFAECVR